MLPVPGDPRLLTPGGWLLGPEHRLDPRPHAHGSQIRKESKGEPPTAFLSTGSGGDN